MFIFFSSPVKDTVVVNDRWGVGDRCHHGGVYTCGDRYNPGENILDYWPSPVHVEKTTFSENIELRFLCMWPSCQIVWCPLYAYLSEKRVGMGFS